ncbi:MAG TPA: hypothetical protein VIV12_10275, partial [Streptosporangiaceae bacterium]
MATLSMRMCRYQVLDEQHDAVRAGVQPMATWPARSLTRGASGPASSGEAGADDGLSLGGPGCLGPPIPVEFRRQHAVG